MADNGGAPGTQVDAVVVGAGFAGLYAVYRLRGAGFSLRAFEGGDDVGGTWYWNRYPGARCDVATTDYTYSFDPALEDEWEWSEKYATQPEILRYLGYVADRYDLRRDITFSTRLESAAWDERAAQWLVRTDRGDAVRCRFLIMATGCLSAPKTPDIEGTELFRGEVYFTNRWPHEPVDFTGKRVAVIGTGSSGIQSIPEIAKQAGQLTVFQRTPNFSMPALNGPPPDWRVEAIATDRAAYRDEARRSQAGIPMTPGDLSVVTAPPDVRRERFDAAWQTGELLSIGTQFNDVSIDPRANEIICELFRDKIRAIVRDPETAEALCPRDYPYGTKRPCLDTGYFETFNLPHVRLVDLRKNPISTITETGIDTVDERMEFDAIVYATGFDAMTGPLVSVDITGHDGVTLKQKWAHGPSTYLGLTTVGFPNFFMITGPGSPSVLSNMTVSIEQHVEWVTDCLSHLRAHGFGTIEPTAVAEAGWDQHVRDCAAITLFDRANSWYMGANVPGKPRVFLPYVGGAGVYRRVCNQVVDDGFLGFTLAGAQGSQCNDGLIFRLQPDVALVLEAMAGLGLPPMDSLPVEEARAMMRAGFAQRPPGPEVGEVVDGVLDGADGPLPFRLYRPASPGPHPVVTYFHGGGWVLGDLDSDDPLCRDLCARSDAIVVSVNYRHAPEHRFPAAADDAFAAVEWVAAHTADIGGIPGQLAIAGWSAGGNIAAVACQRARDAGGPELRGQLLITPVTDDRAPEENAEGFMLTAALMDWFWGHYAGPAERGTPEASPLRGNLSGLPPAVIVTAEFDPLCRQGADYADALAAAGVPVRHIAARGHIHTSLAMVGVVLSGAPVRAEVAGALRGFFTAP
jgi:cation diffusion facilitator CzcD-associated flavoprotein CzcO/acetyl esterase/lipase